MSTKTILISASFALMASTALAQSSKESIIEQLKQQGFTRIEISRTLFGNTRIEATGAGIEREIVLGREGTVMRDRSERDDEGDNNDDDENSDDEDDDTEADDDENDDNENDDNENDHGDDSEGNSGRGGGGNSASWIVHEVIAIVTLFGFIIGGLLIWRGNHLILQRHKEVERLLRSAQGEFFEMLNLQFDRWGLSTAERDVALLTVKGLSVSEIAELRSTSQGTIKSQNNSIYRKAKVKSRTQLLGALIDELLVDG